MYKEGNVLCLTSQVPFFFKLGNIKRQNIIGLVVKVAIS